MIDLKYETTTTYKGVEYWADVYITVKDIVVVKPDPLSWDSDADYYGYKELDFNIDGVNLFDEDGEEQGIIDSQKQIAQMSLDYDNIEVWIWEQLENGCED